MLACPGRAMVTGLVLTALMLVAGCDEGDMYQAMPPIGPSIDTQLYDITGYWVGSTGSGKTFTLQLVHDDNDYRHFPGTMTRNGEQIGDRLIV